MHLKDDLNCAYWSQLHGLTFSWLTQKSNHTVCGFISEHIIFVTLLSYKPYSNCLPLCVHTFFWWSRPRLIKKTFCPFFYLNGKPFFRFWSQTKHLFKTRKTIFKFFSFHFLFVYLRQRVQNSKESIVSFLKYEKCAQNCHHHSTN